MQISQGKNDKMEKMLSTYFVLRICTGCAWDVYRMCAHCSTLRPDCSPQAPRSRLLLITVLIPDAASHGLLANAVFVWNFDCFESLTQSDLGGGLCVEKGYKAGLYINTSIGGLIVDS